MPPRKGFRQVLSTRRLRPLASRAKNVEKTIELVEELVKLELEKSKTKASTSESIGSQEISEEVNSSGKVSPDSGKIESFSDLDSTDSESLPTTPGKLDHNRFADEMDNPPSPIDPMM